jgi:uncharacterized protein (TIGR02646 family)
MGRDGQPGSRPRSTPPPRVTGRRPLQRGFSARPCAISLTGSARTAKAPLDVTSYLEIDHYVAKTTRRDMAFEWTNLLPACRLCNNAKGEHDHQGALLKPDADYPEPYFWIHPDTGKLEPHPKLDGAQSHRANETIRLCALQRPALCTKRAEMLMRVLRWLSKSSKPAVNTRWPNSIARGLPAHACAIERMLECAKRETFR